ncbi:MAG TPA: glycogen/starch synthase [Candidatus Limnocylindrales bacterium]|jgi:starch synthase
MRIVSVAAECEPWAKAGGLGDVVDALARSLGRTGALDQPVDVFLPAYRSVVLPPGAAVETLTVTVPGPYGPATGAHPNGSANVVIRSLLTHGYRLRLVDHPVAFDRDGIYGFDDDPWRFGLLGRAVLETLRAEGQPIDLLHVHDWHASTTVVLRDRFYAGDRIVGQRSLATLLTIHNLAYHGWVGLPGLASLGLAPGDRVVAPGAAGIDLLWAGIERATLVNTVSPTFAAEALTPAVGFGLDPTLQWKADQADLAGRPRFFGILNGIDPAVWDPATDADLAAPYSALDLAGKAGCRADLLERVGFDPGDDGPVLGMIGRLDPQKGFDLLAEAAPRLLASGARLIVQGSGDPALAAPFRALAQRRPDRIVLNERFDRAMARRIYAGADLYVMPSRFEPCGQGQMIALRYGTPPVVHRTGGLADTVVDEYLHPGAGTGFVFDHPTADGLAWACEQAFEARGDAAGWARLVGRGMAVDNDWASGPTAAYLDAARRAVALAAAPPPAGRRSRAPKP